MTKKWIAINLMLLLGAGLLSWQLYVSAQRFNAENSLAKLEGMPAAKKKSAPEAALPAQQPVKKYSDAEYGIIPAANLFAESRKPEEKTDTPAPEPPKKLDNPPILVGIVVSGSQRVAMINDPTAPNVPGTRRTQTMRVGDNYRGFVVTDITQNGMVLESGPSREVVPLFAPGKSPQQGKTPILATQVVNFGPGQARSPGGAAVVTSAAAGRTTPISSPAPTAGSRPAQPQTPAQQRGSAQATQQAPAIQFQQPTQLYPNQYIDAQGRVMTQSPFGTFPVQQQTIPPQQQPVKK
ncbi:MAG: hypothetical protein LAP85_19225 [Acidobacteriia bacterium]|nr:hypothetical protein [Terriglobia bacterium]